MNHGKSKLIPETVSGKAGSHCAGMRRTKRRRVYAFLAALMLPLVIPAHASTTVRVEWGSPTGIAVF